MPTLVQKRKNIIWIQRINKKNRERKNIIPNQSQSPRYGRELWVEKILPPPTEEQTENWGFERKATLSPARKMDAKTHELINDDGREEKEGKTMNGKKNDGNKIWLRCRKNK